MSDTTSEHDDLNSTQEYTIAGIVILLFGLLYWLFNHGFPTISFNNDAQPATAVVADSNSVATQKQSLAGSEKSANTASAEQDNDSNSANTDGSKQQFATKQASSVDGTAQTPMTQGAMASAESGSASNAPAQSTAQSEDSSSTGNASDGTTQNAMATDSAANSSAQQQIQSCNTAATSTLAERVITDPAVLQLRGHLLTGKMEEPVLMDSFSFANQSGQAEISADTQTLDLAALMQQNPTAKILIRGHTADEGSAADSKTLSLGRATSVGQKLVEACATAGNIIIMGMGDAEPLSNNNQQNRGNNRRIDVAITQ